MAARDHARRAGCKVNLLSDYSRTSGLTGLVVGFGGVSDAELEGTLGSWWRVWRVRQTCRPRSGD